MRRTYTFIQNHTLLLLAILSLLMIAEMGVAMWNIVPIGYEWLLRWILILTILIWTGMAGRVRLMWDWDSCLLFLGLSSATVCIVLVIFSPILISLPVPGIFLLLAVLAAMVISALTGLIIPADHSGRKVYWIFVIAPLVFLALIMTYHLFVVFFGSGYWESIVEDIYFLLLLGLIGGVLGLLIQLHGENISSGRYVVVALRSLGAAAFVVVWILASIVLAATGSSPLSVIAASVVFVPLSASSSLALLVAWWIGGLPPLWRKIFVSVVGLWVIYMAMGWFWLIAMDDSLRAFTAEERAAAEVALGKTERYIDVFDPWKRRVVKDGDGQFDVVFYTWWGLKARLYPYGRTTSER